ncbi:MAG TPA: methyltransferase domain-containing protein [Pyrinomonadaceae bacterium]|nr:methyltransferase domain-containing protein [Pyrinomonadaceae bacterium]
MAADWDERYSRGEHTSEEPSRLLARAVELFEGGGARGEESPRALDIACGAGRHALFLASHGFDVTAVDASFVGVGLTRARAAKRGLRLVAVVADLERGEFAIEPEGFDLVCDFYYLQRDLLPAARAGVRPGGLFVAAIHLDDGNPEARPGNPDFLLRPGELREEFGGWEILHYSETQGIDEDAGRHTRRSAELIARKPARAGRP